MTDRSASRSRVVKGLQTVFDLESSGRVLFYSVIVGVVAGLGAAGFYLALDYFKEFAQWDAMGYAPPPAGTEHAHHDTQWPTHAWAVALVPVIGGLLCGLIVFRFAPEAEGHGTDGLIHAFHKNGGRIRGRVPVVKTIASILTIGTGGSAGREGPIAQIGAGFGSQLADRLGLSDRERRILVLAGAAGGVGAMFQAPLGGALFAVEVIYSSMAIEFMAFVPCVVASVVAYSTFNAIFGDQVAIHAGGLAFGGAAELPFYFVFAIPCAAVGFFYVWTFYGLRDKLFRRMKVPNYVKPAIGGLVLGLIALQLPHVMSGGYGWIQSAVNGTSDMTIRLMLILVFAKIIATSFTISSGGSGGVFAPSLFIGAMLGGAFGEICNSIPVVCEYAPDTGAFVLVGMGAFFAGVAKVPLTALIMVSEMSHSYELLVPLMLVSVINVAVLSSRWTLYEEQVSSLIDSPAHLGEFIVDVLEGIKVGDLPDPGNRPIVLREDTPLEQVLRLVAGSREAYFPVTDHDDELVGILGLSDIRSELIAQGVPSGLILASDVCHSTVVTVTMEDDLLKALRLCTRENIVEIPIVEKDRPGHLIRMLSREEILHSYDRRLTEIRAAHR